MGLTAYRLAAMFTVVAATTCGCVFTLPEPITTRDVAVLEQRWNATVADPTQRANLVESARRCGTRLNSHRNAAATSAYLQLTLNGLGGLVAGVGSVLSTQFPQDPTVEDVMIGLAIGGAALTLITTFVVSLSANPIERLRLHTLGLRSWDQAVTRSFDSGTVGEIRDALQACRRDEAPEARSSPDVPMSPL